MRREAVRTLLELPDSCLDKERCDYLYLFQYGKIADNNLYWCNCAKRKNWVKKTGKCRDYKYTPYDKYS